MVESNGTYCSTGEVRYQLTSAANVIGNGVRLRTVDGRTDSGCHIGLRREQTLKPVSGPQCALLRRANAHAEYPFAKYNVPSTPYVYTHEEYTRLLEGRASSCTPCAIPDKRVDASWTKDETDYLFNLVREYDGRFYVVHDRYEYQNGPQRSLEVCLRCLYFDNGILNIL